MGKQRGWGIIKPWRVGILSPEGMQIIAAYAFTDNQNVGFALIRQRDWLPDTACCHYPGKVLVVVTHRPVRRIDVMNKTNFG